MTDKTKIFVSYKYADSQVEQKTGYDKIELNPWTHKVTPRSYLNKLSDILNDYAIEKWEKDDEDLSNFKDDTIASKLKDKIYDSSITIILISPGMKVPYQEEADQWIPWEISYSLKEIPRNGKTSRTNGVVAVVLPDINKSYDYCIEKGSCCTTLKFGDKFCFKIIADNFFNKKNDSGHKCDKCGRIHYDAIESHYFVFAKWCDFITRPSKYLDIAQDHKGKTGDYNIRKTV